MHLGLVVNVDAIGSLDFVCSSAASVRLLDRHGATVLSTHHGESFHVDVLPLYVN